jgi:hypothetical protein
MRLLFPERPLPYVGPRAVLDAGFALGLLGLVLLIAASLGWKALRWLGIQELTQLEQALFALALGMGILAYGVLALGLLGLLQTWALLLWLLAAAIFAWRELSELVSRLPSWVARQAQALGESAGAEKAVLVVGGIILGSSLLQALAPPWGYDALMYHLLGPRHFLQEGRILLLPETWQANGPFTIEMLYALGLALGSDTFAKLLHLVCAVCLVLATFGFGRRYLGQAGGWLAAALLLGVPVFPSWAIAAYADMAWAFYELLALYALMLWKEKDHPRLLAIAAMMMGWAMGSKYLALGGLAVLGLWILWQGRHIGLSKAFTSVATFGIVCSLVALPWYVKTLVQAGNPIYPFLFGGPGWDTERLRILMAYMRSFGVGRHLFDFLLLPWNLYARNTEFGTLGAAFEVPGLLVPLAALYPIGSRCRTMNDVAGITGLHFVVWAVGSQQTRFLLPILPALALLSAGSGIFLMRRLQNRWKGSTAVGYLIIGVALLATLVFQVILFAMVQPPKVILGQQSKQEFLRHSLVNFRALETIQDRLSTEERALMMWDGQGYYCDERCVPDADQSNWTRLIEPESEPEDVASRLRTDGITHLLFNRREAEFFLSHDPTGRHRQALDFFLWEFLPTCTEEIYRDRWMLLAEITCG